MKKFYTALSLFLMAISSTYSQTELKPDPALSIEKLPNGVTIAVYRNLEPPKRVSMRLLVRRGSATETEEERGLAHFIEHMAFNGTKNFPAGDMVEYFQRLGMAFGADTNAHTSFNETVYKLDMPDVSQSLIEDGLKLLRDYADGILFEKDAIEKERGVIIAEKKSRESQSYKRAVKEIGHLFKGSIYPDRMPIGIESVIKNADREKFLNYYHENYRPENMVVVIVGDIDVEKILKDAKKYFSDMKAVGEKQRIVDLGKLESSNKKFSFSDESIDADALYVPMKNIPSASVSVSVSKQKSKEDSIEKRYNNARLLLLSNAITARYARISSTPQSQISDGSGGFFCFDNFADTFTFSAQAPVGKSKEALEENFRQLLSLDSLSDEEIENAKKKLFADLQNQIDGKSTRKNPKLANEIVNSFSDNEVFTSPEFDMFLAKESLKDFNAKDAKKLLTSIFDNAKLKVFISDTSQAPEKNTLDKIVRESYTKALNSKYNAETFAINPLIFSQFKNQNANIKKSNFDKELQIEQLEFENGVKVNLKTTDFSKDEILMKISFGNGILDLPKNKPEYYASLYALICGGTKFQSFSEINSAQAYMKFSLGVEIDGNSFSISGRSTRKDFSNMINLSATMIADAGFRDDGIQALEKNAEAFYRGYQTNPIAKIRYASMRLSESNFKNVPGNFEDFKKIKMQDIKEWLTPILKNSQLEISIVGDFKIEEVKKLISETFAKLPKRDSKQWVPFVPIKFIPTGSTLDLTYKTEDEPRSIASKFWLSSGRENMEVMRTENLLGVILDDRLRKEIREKEGKVYSPFAYNNSSQWIKDTGFMVAMTFVVPESNKQLAQLLEKCGKELLNDISKDEFERAKIPLVKSVEANLRKNEYWLAVLDRSQSNPELFKMAKTIRSGYENIELEHVKEAAKKVFSKPPYSISVMPDKKD